MNKSVFLLVFGREAKVVKINTVNPNSLLMKSGIEKPIITGSSSSDVPWITGLEEVGFQILDLYDKIAKKVVMRWLSC